MGLVIEAFGEKMEVVLLALTLMHWWVGLDWFEKPKMNNMILPILFMPVVAVMI